VHLFTMTLSSPRMDYSEYAAGCMSEVTGLDSWFVSFPFDYPEYHTILFFNKTVEIPDICIFFVVVSYVLRNGVRSGNVLPRAIHSIIYWFI
jgi:hypothetical protein